MCRRFCVSEARVSDGVGKTSWSKPQPNSVPIPGQRERGTHCPNCDFPIDDPKAVVAKTPTSASWTCSHCGWVMRASYHGPNDNRQPGGNLIARPF